MRLETIQSIRKAHSLCVPSCELDDISDYLQGEFKLQPRESIRRRAVRVVARLVLKTQQNSLRSIIGSPLPTNSLLCRGERFGDDASRSFLLSHVASEQLQNVLVPGCFIAGEDIQFWLRRGIANLTGIDVNNLKRRWAGIVPQLVRHYRCGVQFIQSPIEALPFEAGSFDLIYSTAVLEHVQNIHAMCSETARVLRPAGWAWHSFGPLYYSFSGDHCISDYGFEAGYDHLLLDETTYQNRISDQSFYDRQADPNCAYWARKQQFSFATMQNYLDSFADFFHIRHLVIKISTEGLIFKQRFPEKWDLLLQNGMNSADLLIKGLSVTLQKK
jgi:ubiquinone/menaquinone biosynthesis C-methylase UbiE